jgi:hypothetical protein
MAKKLYVYDSTSELDRDQAECRFGKSNDLVTLPVASAAQLEVELIKLKNTGATFDRVVIQTHGNSGMIFFNHQALTGAGLKMQFAGKGFESMFPSYTRIYFDGCNVAEGSRGEQFLTTAGEIFLRNGGGEVMGFRSLGTAIPWWVPFIAGHTVHFNDGFVKIQFAPGGTVFTPPLLDLSIADKRVWTGRMQ